MFEMNLGLFGGRGGDSGGYSEFYRNRLAAIDAEIKTKQITASLDAPGNSAMVRRAAKTAQRRIEQLRQQYDQLEAIAKRDRRERRRG